MKKDEIVQLALDFSNKSGILVKDEEILAEFSLDDAQIEAIKSIIAVSLPSVKKSNIILP